MKHRFAHWLEKKKWPVLVQDGEPCLWCDEPLKEFKDLGVELIDWHPSYSPDFNPIENAWSCLRKRLADTTPQGDEIEGREDFIRRLRSAVAWINKNDRRTLVYLCRNQKERARDCLANEGHQTDW